MGFPHSSVGRESTCNVVDLGLIPGLGRSPGEGKGYPLQYSGLENPMDFIVHGVAKSHTRLSNFHFLFLSLSWTRNSSPSWSEACLLVSGFPCCLRSTFLSAFRAWRLWHPLILQTVGFPQGKKVASTLIISEGSILVGPRRIFP